MAIQVQGNFAYGNEVILRDVRLAWADIWRPGDGKNGGDPKYKINGLIVPDSDAHQVAKREMLEAAKALWAENVVNVVRAMPANNKALRNGDDRLDDSGAARPEYAGMMVVVASNKAAPQIIGPRMVERNGKKHFVHLLENGRCVIDGVEQERPPYTIVPPYRGCFVNAKVQFIAGKSFTTGEGEKKKTIPNQVYARLHAIQFLRDGDAFGPGGTSADGFGDEDVPVTNAADSDDPFGDGSSSSAGASLF